MPWNYVITDRAGWTTEYSSEQSENAAIIWYKLTNDYGFTFEAAAGVLGNLQAESQLNPGQWQIGSNYSMSAGMGLGQWTPATKVSNYCGTTTREIMANGTMQLELLNAVPEQYNTIYLNPDGTSNYYNESGLPYITTMYDYSVSTEAVSDLTKLWAICWERPASSYYTSSISDRIRWAEHWYYTFTGNPPDPPDPDPPEPLEDELLWWNLKLLRIVQNI